MNYQHSNTLRSWIFVTHRKTCFSKIFLALLKCDFSWFQPIIGRFYKMRVSWEFNIYNLFKSFLLTRCYRFLTRCEYYLWLDSKYNVRRCDVLVQNKTIHSLNLFALDRIFSLKMATWAIGKTFHVIRGRVVCIIVFIVSIWSDLLVFCWWFMSNIRNVFVLNSIGCVTKCGPAGILEGNTTRQMYVRPTCSNLHTERFEVIF